MRNSTLYPSGIFSLVTYWIYWPFYLLPISFQCTKKFCFPSTNLFLPAISQNKTSLDSSASDKSLIQRKYCPFFLHGCELGLILVSLIPSSFSLRFLLFSLKQEIKEFVNYRLLSEKLGKTENFLRLSFFYEGKDFINF